MAAATTTTTIVKDWSFLPPDLLVVIINLLHYPCCLLVRAVCRSWSLTAANTPYSPTNPELPWLVGSTSTSTEEDGTLKFYSLSARRSHRLNLLPRGRCLASSHGWIVFAPTNENLHLLNPITRVTFPLPNIYYYYPIKKLQPYYHKVKLLFRAGSGSGSSQDCYIFVLHSYTRGDKELRLSYASAGNQTWTEIRDSCAGLVDFVFHKGKLYGLFKDARLAVVDNLLSPNLRFIDNIWTVVSFACRDCFRQTLYLVDSVDGEDLLLILRRENELDTDDPLSVFMVFKLEEGEESRWITITRFDQEVSIFLGGDSTSMILSTRGLPELKESCIYLIDGREEAVFKIDNFYIHGTIARLCHDHLGFSPHWFTPTL